MLASIYKENNSNQYRDNQYIINKYQHLLRWKRNESILEIGPGDGKSTTNLLMPIFPKDFKEYVGADVSNSVVAYLGKNLLDDRCKFLEMDISRDEIPTEFENRFDHIFSFIVLHWCKDPRKAVENIKKMLKPGGQFFLTFITDDLVNRIASQLSMNPRWSKLGHKKYISSFFKEDGSTSYFERWQNHFENFNLKIEFATHNTSNYQFSNEQFKGFLASLDPFLSIIKKEDLADYTADVVGIVSQYLSTIDEKNDVYILPFDRALFCGSKPY